MVQLTSRSFDSDATVGSWHTAGTVVGTCAGRPELPSTAGNTASLKHHKGSERFGLQPGLGVCWVQCILS